MTIVLLGGAAAATFLLACIILRADYRNVLLFAVTFTMPMRNISLASATAINVRVGDVVLMAAVALVVLELVTGKPLHLVRIHYLLLGVVAWMAFSVVWSLDPQFGIVRVAKFARNFALFFVLAWWMRDRFVIAYRYVVGGTMASFLFIVPMMIWSVLHRGLDMSSLSEGGATSTALAQFRKAAGEVTPGTVNVLGLWVNVAIFLWLGTSGWAHPKASRRFLFWAVLALLMATEIATFSRGCWLALALAGVWWLRRIGAQLSRRMIVIACAGVIVGIIALYASGLLTVMVQRLATLENARDDAAVSQRLTFWSLAIQALRRSPLGVGIGGTTVAVGQYAGQWFVHNLYLQMMVEMGPVGFVILGAAFVTALVRLKRATRAAIDGRSRVAAASITAAILAYLALGLTGCDLTELEIWMLFAFAAVIPIARPIVVMPRRLHWPWRGRSVPA